ncbi:MAG: 1-acyl-sn-glycerol-3-phosphate acyltransferase [Acidobacteriota bacterium]|nr:1-acyl-sn-glycerol-3-phosphate acyltransferase [Acidobacteriota bacterium]
MTARQHLKAAICLAAITLNLTFWALLLLVLLPAKAAPRTRPWFRRVAARIYRAAVRVDNVLLRRVSRAAWRVRELSLDPTRPHIVLSNHRSWADIFLVQSLIATRGPIVTFLCKRELLYVPIFGLIILAFDFPVLRRRTRRGANPAGRRDDDRRRVAEAAAALLGSPAAILSFAEGTRFTAAKRDANRRAARDGQGAPTTGMAPQYEHLLPPRAGGLAAMIEALAPGGGSIVDLTLAYPRPSTFWEFLGGAAGSVEVAWEAIPIATVKPDEAANWLNDRWRRKEESLDRSL